MTDQRNDCRRHYDALIDENNDPVWDPAILKAYMDKWDGAVLIETLQLSPQKNVLEIGIGTGRLAIRVVSECKSLTGIDCSPKTIQRARQNLSAFENVTLVCSDFMTYGFTQKFDVIYSSLTFMHIEDKQAAINKAASLLMPKGRFVLSIEIKARKSFSITAIGRSGSFPIRRTILSPVRKEQGCKFWGYPKRSSPILW